MERAELELSLSHAIFREMCFNCGGDITDYRLSRKYPCSNCLREPPSEEVSIEKILLELRRMGRARGVAEIAETREIVEEFSRFFEKVVGSKPWSAQRTWALRALKGTSFAILAPTGVGKTLFGPCAGALSWQLKARRATSSSRTLRYWCTCTSGLPSWHAGLEWRNPG